MMTEIQQAAKRSVPHLAGDITGAVALAAIFFVALYSPSFF